jgi:hypothetical protein
MLRPSSQARAMCDSGACLAWPPVLQQGPLMPSMECLFSGPGWLSVDRHQRQEMARDIESMDGNRLLCTAVDDLAKYFAEKYHVAVPELDVGNLVVDHRETEIEVSGESLRMVMGRSQPAYVKGTEVEAEIPFIGDAKAFAVQPSPFSLNPPRATISGSRVAFTVVGTSLGATDVKREIDTTVTSIQSCLTNLRGNFAGLNAQLFDEARAAIEARRTKLLASQNMVASLGFKVRERQGAPTTYVAPEIRRRITPVMPQAGSTPFKPEPALSDEDYDHILGVMQSMTQVMELSPSAFHAVNEEALRSHFLVQLNGHYQGQATGETFNYEGKTDILIRSEGKNIFIAECKFWSGSKGLAETIDQLLSYSSWRDTKTAVVILNRNRDFSRVIAAIPDAVRKHPQYKRDLSGSTETAFRYVFANRDDRNRELLLTVLAFDVPTPRSEA